MSKQFCCRGHDTYVVGRDRTGGRCSECRRLAERGRRRNMPSDSLLFVRLPIEPLVELMAAKGVSIRSLGPSLSRQFARWKALGYISIASGDRLACEVLGVHPFEVWGTAWLDLSEEVAS